MDEDFIHISGLVQFGSFSWIHMIPESIVVGIANADRKKRFTYPTNNKKTKKIFLLPVDQKILSILLKKNYNPS